MKQCGYLSNCITSLKPINSIVAPIFMVGSIYHSFLKYTVKRIQLYSTFTMSKK